MKFDIFPPAERLTLYNIDKFIEDIRISGGELKGLVLHFKQYQKLNEELCKQHRYVDVQQIGSTYLATYRGIPVYPMFFGDGYKCEACGGGVTGAFLFGHKIVFCCKDHENRAKMFDKFEESE